MHRYSHSQSNEIRLGKGMCVRLTQSSVKDAIYITESASVQLLHTLRSLNKYIYATVENYL